MAEQLKLMCILAHPDDESLATGGTLAKYAAEGVETYLITATRGEWGWFGPEENYPGPAALGQIREAELNSAAEFLGLREVIFLDYEDGKLAQADQAEAVRQIVSHLRRIRPQVILTFDPFGVYGHPDHIAISQLSLAAVVAAADLGYGDITEGLPHQVSKLYYRIFSADEGAAYQAAFGELVMTIDGVKRGFTAWPEWAATTQIETTAYWPQVWQAIACHRSQLPGYRKLKALPAEYHQKLWGRQAYYRAFSLVSSGLEIEHDLFAGLREPAQPQRSFYVLRQFLPR
jgi:LmbE family N-acetylglucosaminyl deacetylase